MELDCTTCGACCFGLTVWVHPEDEVRLSADEVLRLTAIDPEGQVRRMKQRDGGACVALVQQEGRFACSIYERRPDACRNFEPGARHCLAQRERRGVYR